MKVTIYVEGGGDTNATKIKCRKGFSKFFENATFKGCMPTIIACGGRLEAYKNFCTALANPKSNEFPVLLVDSEDLISTASKWEHLKNREGDQWAKPATATEDHVYLMTVCMEAWFMADKEAVAEYYVKDFNSNSLPANPKIEQIQKMDLFSGLKQATETTKKGEYSKGGHSFDILAKIKPEKVMNASPKAKEMICYLEKIIKPGKDN